MQHLKPFERKISLSIVVASVAGGTIAIAWLIVRYLPTQIFLPFRRPPT